MVENKRIIIVVNQDINIFYYRLELVKYLVSKGYEVTICCPKSNRTDEFAKLGCSFVDTPIQARGRNPFSDLNYYLRLKKIFKEIKPLVIFPFTIKPNIYSTYAASKLKIPCCPNITGLGVAIENEGILKKVALALSKKSFTKAKYVFFQNIHNRDYYNSLGVVKKSQNILLPGSGVNLNRHCYEEYPSESDGIRFLFFGRLLEYKGIVEYIKVAEQFKDNEKYHFACLGALDDTPNEIKEMVKNSSVKYLGYTDDVHSIIKTYHVIVLPSSSEGMANVLLESAACGRPVIASDIHGCKETFDDGITGFSCKPLSFESLYKSVEKFNSLTEEQHREMGKLGRAKIEKEFSRNLVVEKYYKVVKQIEKENKI